jgi:hypothetical protein
MARSDLRPAATNDSRNTGLLLQPCHPSLDSVSPCALAGKHPTLSAVAANPFQRPALAARWRFGPARTRSPGISRPGRRLTVPRLERGAVGHRHLHLGGQVTRCAARAGQAPPAQPGREAGRHLHQSARRLHRHGPAERPPRCHRQIHGEVSAVDPVAGCGASRTIRYRSPPYPRRPRTRPGRLSGCAARRSPSSYTAVTRTARRLARQCRRCFPPAGWGSHADDHRGRCGA